TMFHMTLERPSRRRSSHVMFQGPGPRRNRTRTSSRGSQDPPGRWPLSRCPGHRWSIFRSKECVMDLRDDPMPTAQPLVPRPVDAAAPAPAAGTDLAVESTAGPGVKRMVLTAALSAMLLVGGAVAVVSAASPDPS